MLMEPCFGAIAFMLIHKCLMTVYCTVRVVLGIAYVYPCEKYTAGKQERFYWN